MIIVTHKLELIRTKISKLTRSYHSQSTVIRHLMLSKWGHEYKLEVSLFLGDCVRNKLHYNLRSTTQSNPGIEEGTQTQNRSDKLFHNPIMITIRVRR